MRITLAVLWMSLLAPPQEFKQENKPENLKQLFEKLTKAISGRDDPAAIAGTKSLLLDEARIRKALREDVDKEFLAKAVAMHAELLKAEDSKLAVLFSPGDPKRSEVQVHGATTEEIARYEKDGVPFKEFPGGAKKLAESVLRPGTTFYEVEIVEPGKDSGMKFHLFFWDGGRWAMLGPAWRLLPK